MAREPLPDRRRSWTQKVRLGVPPHAQTFYLSCGEYPDGRLGEVWLDAAKEGTFTRGVCGAMARMASIALQNGVPVAEVVASLRHLNFPPNGPVEGSAAVAEASSVADWVAREIEAAYPPAPPPAPPQAGAGKVAGEHHVNWSGP